MVGEPLAASRRASRTSVCGSPSSRTARAALKYIRLRAMRTAVRDTRGVARVSRATVSMQRAPPQATG